ncbi:hypothetical protein [Streptomyces sp. NPDC056144]|uniref:hypothetical protein n=1 Tax=unclassified Streptomyces TaxID=2593676 RepID=UPI0035DC7907
MSASENSGRNPFPWTGLCAVPAQPDRTRGDGPDSDLLLFPAPVAENDRARAAGGAEGGRWSATRAHPAVTAGAVAGAAAVLAVGYGWGRRSGRLAARRGLGPVALFLRRHG